MSPRAELQEYKPVDKSLATRAARSFIRPELLLSNIRVFVRSAASSCRCCLRSGDLAALVLLEALVSCDVRQ